MQQPSGSAQLLPLVSCSTFITDHPVSLEGLWEANQRLLLPRDMGGKHLRVKRSVLCLSSANSTHLLMTQAAFVALITCTFFSDKAAAAGQLNQNLWPVLEIVRHVNKVEIPAQTSQSTLIMSMGWRIVLMGCCSVTKANTFSFGSVIALCPHFPGWAGSLR